jgi:organic radical activating enzyme
MSNKQRIIDLQEKVDQLNAVSPTFCLAKWKQSTTTLYNGMTHSCHHPVQHKIQVEDIQKNPRGLHNTPIKIVARKDMLKGIQTKECDYCWNIENLGQNHFSDRHYKSATESMGIWQSFDEVLKSGVGENIAPAYLEVAFENTCNFKCSYCSPDVSSRWMEEIQAHGPIKLSTHHHHHLDWLKQTGRFPIHHKEHNPYIEAFWKWWPELYKSLDTFRITGGEPLLSENTWKVFDHIIAEPRKELAFSLNTNMGIPVKLVDKLIDRVNQVDGKIRNISIFTSAESTGAQAEYSRFGMDWELFKSNCERFLEKTGDDVRLQLMTTVNVFSVSTFADFLRWISALRLRFNKTAAHNRIGFSVAYLRWPRFLCLTQLDENQKKAFAQSMKELLDELQAKGDIEKMYLEEVDMINRMVNFTTSQEQDPILLKDFKLFIDEYDKRRGTDFHAVFPELKAMYDQGTT